MGRFVLMTMVVSVLVATGALKALAGGEHCGDAPAKSAPVAGGECAPGKAATASVASQRGKIIGRFDPAMSGMCRFACATKLKHSAKEVLGQPGAKPGKLTQCPVSGVVFAVDANRPHVRIAKDEYVTCCDKCATKLKSAPRRYVRA